MGIDDVPRRGVGAEDLLTASSPFVAAVNIPDSVGIAGNIAIEAVAVGDFNNNGHPDILIANAGGGNGLSLLPGLGGGQFGAPIVSAPGAYYSTFAVGDFNHDGNLDVAAGADVQVTSGTQNVVTMLMGNGDGTFHTWFSYAVGQGVNTVVAADFNGDGNLDLATSNDGSDNVSVLIGNHNGTFKTAVVCRRNPVGPLVTGDFNGDGKPDLAVLNQNPGGSEVTVLSNNGDGAGNLAITSDGSVRQSTPGTSMYSSTSLPSGSST